MDLTSKNQKTIFVDFDGTIANSIKKIVELYSKDFRSYDEFKPIHWTSVESWEFTELCAATPEQIDLYFNQPRFFEDLEYMDGALEALGLLHYMHGYKIVVVSCGHIPNLREKKRWLEYNMPYIQFEGINLDKETSKSGIDMSGGIFIDDMARHLDESNADMKICFGDKYPWNEDWEGIRSYNWYDVYELITGQDFRGGVQHEIG